MGTSTLIFVFIGVVSGELNWNMCNVRDPLHIVGPVSLKECMRSCKMVSDCTGITYTYRGLVCKFHDTFVPQDACPGSVAVPEDEFDVDVDDDCAVRQCPPLSTCDEVTKRCMALTVCGPPQTQPASMTDGNMRTEGSKVKVTCTDGREFISSCQSSGQWTEVPSCGCGPPPDVANAEIGSLSGASVTYTCQSGYVLFTDTPGGTATYNCLDTGLWETPAFQCIDCGDPPTVANAVMSSSSGPTVTYTCLAGHELVPDTPGGAAVSSCLVTGLWETPAIQCIDCGDPLIISKADSRMSGSTVTYTCQTGYEFVPDTPGGTAVYNCQGGTWETPAFKCLVKSIGLSCGPDIFTCLEGNSHCLTQRSYTYTRVCVCLPLHEYDSVLRTCVQVCSAYSETEYVRTDITIPGFNLGETRASDVDDCFSRCYDAFGDDCPGFDFWGTSCYCSSISLQQVFDSAPSVPSDSGLFRARACIPLSR